MIQVARGMWRQTIEQVKRCGKTRLECVVYWVGPANDASLVTEVVHPLHRASHKNYDVDAGWLDRFWVQLAQTGKSARVQVHTHVGAAFHSESDDRWPLILQTGFLSLVLPAFGSKSLDSLNDAYLAEVGEDLRWHEVEIADRLRGVP